MPDSLRALYAAGILGGRNVLPLDFVLRQAPDGSRTTRLEESGFQANHAGRRGLRFSLTASAQVSQLGHAQLRTLVR